MTQRNTRWSTFRSFNEFVFFAFTGCVGTGGPGLFVLKEPPLWGMRF